MNFLYKLERKVGWIAVPNLTVFIIIGQVLAYALANEAFGNPEVRETMVLKPGAVLDGEFWRLFSFIFLPKDAHPIWLLIGWYVFYFIGSSLEQAWGAFKYTIYILTGWLSLCLMSFVVGFLFGAWGIVITNEILGVSVLLAFACLFPEFEFRLYFILPVKVKWIGYITGGLYFMLIVINSLPFKLIILAGFANLFLFFGSSFINLIKNGKRKRTVAANKKKEAETPFHTCMDCGATDLSNPEREFRYRGEGAVCSDCISKQQKSDSTES